MKTEDMLDLLKEESKVEIKLHDNIVYIVSGLERSGTSLMMQMLEASGLPVVYDDKRKADENNPKGYYETEGGKVIDSILKGKFNLNKYKGKIIKVTAYGVDKISLSKPLYIIYMTRDMDEILESTQKMSKKKFDKEETRELLTKLLNRNKHFLMNSSNTAYFFIDYNKLMSNDPNTVTKELKKVKVIIPQFDINKGRSVIDKKLYRCNGLDKPIMTFKKGFDNE